jgi:vacuolar-type H+-ATPase subunit F/Vma7
MVRKTKPKADLKRASVRSANSRKEKPAPVEIPAPDRTQVIRPSSLMEELVERVLRKHIG